MSSHRLISLFFPASPTELPLPSAILASSAGSSTAHSGLPESDWQTQWRLPQIDLTWWIVFWTNPSLWQLIVWSVLVLGSSFLSTVQCEKAGWMCPKQPAQSQNLPNMTVRGGKAACIHFENTRSTRERQKVYNLNEKACPWKANCKMHLCAK